MAKTAQIFQAYFVDIGKMQHNCASTFGNQVSGLRVWRVLDGMRAYAKMAATMATRLRMEVVELVVWTDITIGIG